ncbi:dihydroneopterin aldolase [Rickettsiales bacterium]|nr:dihydroneopterin aldolase [Rickettsiales bacterium]
MEEVVNINSQYRSVISTNKLRLKMNIGVGEDERKTPQDMDISFKFFYKNPPKACQSDDINDTICYDNVIKIIKNCCCNKTYKLLEYTAYQLYKAIREETAEDIKIWIRVEKCNPPIDEVMGSTSFEYCDL